MRLSGTVLSILSVLGFALSHGSYSRFGSTRGDVFTEGTNGEPAVLPGPRIVFHGPVTRETASDVQGAFAIDGFPLRSHRIEGNAPGSNAAVAVNGVPANQRNRRSVLSVCEQDWKFVNKICELLNAFDDDPEIFLTEHDRKWLKAMDCAFGRKVHHA